MTAPARTALFGLPKPQPDSRNWGQDVLDWLEAAETSLGCNTNLALTANTGQGIGTIFTLARISSGTLMDRAKPSAGRWGRIVLQQTMVEGQQALGRLLGVTTITGLSATTPYGATIYHTAIGPDFTVTPDQAIVSSGGRLLFLPLGFAFAMGGHAFFNGTLPLSACPIRLTGSGLAYKDGSSNPAADFVTAIDSAAPALALSFDAAGTTKHVDLLLAFAVPADFDSWLSTDSDLFWAFRAFFRTTGDAALAAYSVTDSAGNELLISGVSGTSVGSYGTLVCRQRTVGALGGIWTPGTTCYLKLRCSGSTSAQIWVRPNAQLQYFPFTAWRV